MDQFEKNAQMVEEGQSPHLSAFNCPSSPTLTNSTAQPEKSSDNGYTSQASADNLEGKSSIWSQMRDIFSSHGQPAGTSGRNEVNDLENQPSREYTVRSLKQFPSGYPNLATFADSDESFMLFRRFGYLQSRVLLEKQDDLRCLEEQLDALDRSEMYDEPDNLFTRECQGDQRKRLLMLIETKYCEYANLLNAAQKLMAFHRPSASEHRSVVTYVRNECPVDEKESEYVYCKEDLITLRPGRENAWLDRSIEKLLKVLHCSMLEYFFCTKESKKKASNSTQVYYSKDRIEGCSVAIITLMILFLLIVPIYLLFHLVEHSHGFIGGKANAVCIGILLIFTLVFSAVMSLFTTAKKHEILGAAAAYCAVLVVFLGNVGNSSAP